MSIAEKLKIIDSLKSKIEDLEPGKDWDDAFYKKVKLEFTYTATIGEVLDMINHQKILDTIFINYRSQEISEENIKQQHRELMKDSAQWADDGLYSPGQCFPAHN
jgi:hypothetical protein